jgi:hypothetical protein
LAVRPKRPFKAGEVNSALGEQEDQGAAVGIALSQDRTESAERFGPAKDRGGLDIGRKPVAHQVRR